MWLANLFTVWLALDRVPDANPNRWYIDLNDF